MSKARKRLEKLIRKADTGQGDVTWDELESALENLGFKGEGGGSHHCFFHSATKLTISGVAKPHPDKHVKRHICKLVVEHLRDAGMCD